MSARPRRTTAPTARTSEQARGHTRNYIVTLVTTPRPGGCCSRHTVPDVMKRASLLVRTYKGNTRLYKARGGHICSSDCQVSMR